MQFTAKVAVMGALDGIAGSWRCTFLVGLGFGENDAPEYGMFGFDRAQITTQSGS